MLLTTSIRSNQIKIKIYEKLVLNTVRLLFSDIFVNFSVFEKSHGNDVTHNFCQIVNKRREKNTTIRNGFIINEVDIERLSLIKILSKRNDLQKF